MKRSKFRRKYEAMHPDRVVTISNIISILRAFMALPIIYFLRADKGDIALIFILIAIVSDTLDGWLARVSNEITEIGKVLDPIADKIVIFSVMFFLIFTDRMPMFYFIILAMRDLTIVSMGVYLLNNCKVTPAANKLGKVAISFTTATVLAFIYSNAIGKWVDPIMWISIFFLFISLVHYTYSFFHQIACTKKKTGECDQTSKLSQGLKKTEYSIASRLPLLGKFFRIEKDILTSIEETLLATDLGVDLTEVLVDRLKNIDRKKAEKLEDILKSELKSLIKTEIEISETESKPRVILFVGVNGTGKTTTIGKLAYKFKGEGKRVLMVAADTFRAAAYDQLKIWSERANVDFMGNPKGKDPSSVVFDAVKSAQSRGQDVIMIDTAGRLHTKSNLMEELAKIKRVIANLIPDAPHDIWLVLDGNTGQNGIVQAREFMKSVGITGIILTKLDGTAKGGVVLAIHHKFNIPIRYLGIGEQIDDLIEFEPNSFVDALLSNDN